MFTILEGYKEQELTFSEKMAIFMVILVVSAIFALIVNHIAYSDVKQTGVKAVDYIPNAANGYKDLSEL